jgi:hypothetical protein
MYTINTSFVIIAIVTAYIIRYRTGTVFKNGFHYALYKVTRATRRNIPEDTILYIYEVKDVEYKKFYKAGIPNDNLEKTI